MNKVIYTNRIPVSYEIQKNATVNNMSPKSSFSEILKEYTEDDAPVKFSKHAQQRMLQRNIKLSPNEIKKIGEAMQKAQKKGVKDSLILMNDIAFIVNITSKTVITAVDGDNLKENVFTNIDGAVIL